MIGRISPEWGQARALPEGGRYPEPLEASTMVSSLDLIPIQAANYMTKNDGEKPYFLNGVSYHSRRSGMTAKRESRLLNFEDGGTGISDEVTFNYFRAHHGEYDRVVIMRTSITPPKAEDGARQGTTFHQAVEFKPAGSLRAEITLETGSLKMPEGILLGIQTMLETGLNGPTDILTLAKADPEQVAKLTLALGRIQQSCLRPSWKKMPILSEDLSEVERLIADDPHRPRRRQARGMIGRLLTAGS